MNLGMIAGSLVAVGALTYFTVAQTNEINHKKEVAKQVKELQLLTKKQVLEGENTKSGVLNSLNQTGSVKMSSLVLNATQKDKELLDKFQKAMQAVILTNDNPTCEDLNKTKIISYSECEYVLNKEFKYANVENGQIDVSKVDNTLQTELSQSFKGINQQNTLEVNDSVMGTYKSVAVHKKNEAEVLEKNEKVIDDVANSEAIPTTLKVAIIKDKIQLANKVANNDIVKKVEQPIKTQTESKATDNNFIKVSYKVDNGPEVEVASKNFSKADEFKSKMSIYLEIEKQKLAPKPIERTNGNNVVASNNFITIPNKNDVVKQKTTPNIQKTNNPIIFQKTMVINSTKSLAEINQAKQKQLAEQRLKEKQLKRQREEEAKQKSLWFEKFRRFFGFGHF